LNTAKEVVDFLNSCLENGAVPNFKGYFPFKVLVDQGRVAPYYTTIRIMYTGIIDVCYYLNDDGLLEQIGLENPPALDPKEVLSASKNPRGWEPEQLRPPRVHN